MEKYCLFILCAVLFASCTAFVDRYDEYYYLSESVRQMVPYQLGEEVRFTDETGSQIMLTVEKREDYWWKFSERELESWFQYRNIKLQSSNSQHGIDLKLEEWHFIFTHAPRISLAFQPLGKTMVIDFDLEGHFTIPQKDSIMIGGWMYYDVAETQMVYDGLNNDKKDTLQCYYNKPYGVLQVKENDRIVLERIP